MKKKKGFTLIELLAVIVILAIIALIAVPVIMSIIEKANKSAFKDTAYGVINAGELYYAEQQLELNGMQTDKTFSLPSNELDIKGNVPEGTVLKVNTNGETALAMSNGRYCITKGYTDNDITITEEFIDCDVPEVIYTLKDLAIISTQLGVNSIEDCVEKGEVCEIDDDGTAFAIRVNEEDTYKFYVLNDDGNTITLIMNQNLYEDGNDEEPDIEWINQSDYTASNNLNVTPDTCVVPSCTDEGPITAINALNARTSDWDYITAKPYVYSGLAEDGTTEIYQASTRNMRARMITYGEANSLGCTKDSGTCPVWLNENLYETGDVNTYGYWTSTPSSSMAYSAWGLFYNGSLSNSNGRNVDMKSGFGVRPVIELSK